MGLPYEISPQNDWINLEPHLNLHHRRRALFVWQPSLPPSLNGIRHLHRGYRVPLLKFGGHF